MVFVHLAHGFEEIEAVTILDILRRGGVHVMAVSMTGEKIVQGAHGISMQADILFEEADYNECRMIALPGGMPGTKNLLKDANLMEKIKEFSKQDKYLAAICAAPMVFGAAGILDGKKATIYPGMEEYLKNAKPGIEKVIVDGKIITSRGPGTAMEFALTLVDILVGRQISDKLRKDLIL